MKRYRSFCAVLFSVPLFCFRSFTYYKMGNLDNRIANADQLLTQDVEKFCNSVVDLYSNLSKVALSFFVFLLGLFCLDPLTYYFYFP